MNEMRVIRVLRLDRDLMISLRLDLLLQELLLLGSDEVRQQ